MIRAAALAVALAGFAASPAFGAAADPAAALYASRCGGCHALDADRVGPSHQGVVGRVAGTRPGFDYSPALRRAGFRWTRERIERWIADPEAMVPGQKMGYRLDDAAERAAIAAYLDRVARMR